MSYGGLVLYYKMEFLQELELTDEFKANYEKWLHREVYNSQIDWDQLLKPSYQ